MYLYPAKLTRDTNGTLLVTFPDVPEAITFGESEPDALQHASEALEAALSIYMDKRTDIPMPSRPRAGRLRWVGLSALSEAKVALYVEMRAAGIRKAELARRLGWQRSQVDRLLDLNHQSRLDQIEAALGVLNKRLSVRVENAA
jgi:antitoxin HicB